MNIELFIIVLITIVCIICGFLQVEDIIEVNTLIKIVVLTMIAGLIIFGMFEYNGTINAKASKTYDIHSESNSIFYFIEDDKLKSLNTKYNINVRVLLDENPRIEYHKKTWLFLYDDCYDIYVNKENKYD